ncbi:MAG: ubiquinol-cytochrome C chaperone family protein [Pseudomonadota bacterium]
MVLGLFRSLRSVPQADSIYAELMAASRQPGFYADLGVPDTMTGRFDMLVLHVFLFTHRIRDRQQLRDLGQEVFDNFFNDLDASLREVGIGDLTVPKRLKKMANSFYGQVQVYGEPIETGDEQALAAALARNLKQGDQEGGIRTQAIARYMITSDRHLDNVTDEEIAKGKISFPSLEAVGSQSS